MFKNMGPNTSKVRDNGMYYSSKSKKIDFSTRLQAQY